MPDSLRAQILELTQRMRELADASKWEDSALLAQQRQPLLEQLVEAGVEPEELRYLIGVIQDTDQAITEVATIARQQTVSEMRDFRLRNQAAQTYETQAAS